MTPTATDQQFNPVRDRNTGCPPLPVSELLFEKFILLVNYTTPLDPYNVIIMHYHKISKLNSHV